VKCRKRKHKGGEGGNSVRTPITTEQELVFGEEHASSETNGKGAQRTGKKEIN
jgi:hypothetical protein